MDNQKKSLDAIISELNLISVDNTHIDGNRQIGHSSWINNPIAK
jgi:hypothetical protein